MNRPKKHQVRRTLPPRTGEIPGAVQRMETVPFITVQCQEQDLLWEAYSRLVTAYMEATDKLSRTDSTFEKKSADTQSARKACTAARKAWQDHVRKHGCGRV